MTISKRSLPTRTNVAELFDDAPPNKVLEGAVMSNMVGLLSQLGQLSKYATEIFQDLTEEAHGTFERVGDLGRRIENLNTTVPNVERMFRETHPSMFYRNPTAGIPWQAEAMKSGSLFSREHAPQAIDERRAGAAPPPALHLFDRFTDPPSECAKSYSNPGFFFEQWLIAEVARQKASAREKINSRKKKKKKKTKQSKRERKKVESVQVKNYSALGAEFDNQDDPANYKNPSLPSSGPPPAPINGKGDSDDSMEGSRLTPTPPPFHGRSDSQASISMQLDRSRSDSEIKIDDLDDVDSVKVQQSRAPAPEQKLVPPPAPQAVMSVPAVQLSAEDKKAIAESHAPPPLPPGVGAPPPRPKQAAPPPAPGVGPPRPPAKAPPPMMARGGPPIPPAGLRGGPGAAPPLPRGSLGPGAAAPPPLANLAMSSSPPPSRPPSNLMSQIQSGGISLRKAPQERQKAEPKGGRNDLLAAIREGRKLKKVEKKPEDEKKRGVPAGAPTSIFDILARRQVIAGSDDEDDSEDDDDDEDWD